MLLQVAPRVGKAASVPVLGRLVCPVGAKQVRDAAAHQ